MLIGTMNHPAKDVLLGDRIDSWDGVDFIDLTLEPPRADARAVDVEAVRAALEAANLKAVGHTAYYLPLCSPFESIRRAAVEELKVCLQAFATLGVCWMNLHPDRHAPFFDRRYVISRNLQTIRDLLPLSRELGVGLMVENLPEGFNNARQLGNCWMLSLSWGCTWILDTRTFRLRRIRRMRSWQRMAPGCDMFICMITRAGARISTCRWAQEIRDGALRAGAAECRV